MRKLIFPVMAVLLILYSGTVHATIKGDVTGDGRVDGKDALLLLRMIEGLEPITEHAKIAGDVFPINGVGEQPLGDGKLTREDVQQILRVIVGAAQRGEITGEFEPPVIEDFSPRIGTAGTEVTIRGRNFLGGEAGKKAMIVSFGDVPATLITPLSSTELKAIVPPGAKTAQIAITTPGGRTRSREAFIVMETTGGRLSLPDTFDVTNVEVISVMGEGAVDDKGNFSVPSVSGWATLVSVIPKEKPNSVFLSLSSPEDRGEALTVSARSTAEALVLLQPLFITVDGELQAHIRKKLNELPELEALSQAVEQIWSDSADPFNDERLDSPLKAAVDALVNSLGASSGSASRAEERSATSSQQLSERYFLNVDTQFIDPRFDGDSVIIGLRFGSPVDWFVRLARLDVNELPDSLSSLKADEVYKRLDFSDITFLPATRITSEVIGAIVPIVVNAISRSIPGTIGATGEAAAGKLLPTERKLLLESNVKQGVYVIRAFSGILFGSGGTDSTTIPRLPYGRGDQAVALLTNIILAAWEVINVYVPALSAIPPSVGDEIVRQVSLVVYDEIEFLLGGSSASPYRGVLPSPEGRKELANKLYQIVVKATQAIILRLQDRVPERMREILKKVAGQLLDKNIGDIAAKIAGILPVAERVAGIAGLQIPGLDMLKLTPLETSFVIIGNPFGVVIDPFNPFKPRQGGAGDRVTIVGWGFDLKPENNEVYFSGVKAEVLEVKENVPLSYTADKGRALVVEVPKGVPPGDVPVTVKVKGTKASVAYEKFHNFRVPIIQSFSPEGGFTGGGTFKGEPFKGTKVIIEGKFFDPGEDEVLLGGKQAEVITDESNSERLIILVPQGASTSPFIIRTPKGYTSESEKAFKVEQQVPVLSGVYPQKVQAYGRINLWGEHFGFHSSDIIAWFRYDSKTISQKVDFLSSSYLATVMPSEIPEGETVYLSLETPAGKSEELVLKRLGGEAKQKGGEGAIDLTAKRGVVADGKLSLEEGLGLMQGKLDPTRFFTSPFDDADLDIEVKTDVYDNYITGERRWTSTLVSKKWHKEPTGHEGHEYVYYTEYVTWTTVDKHPITGEIETFTENEIVKGEFNMDAYAEPGEPDPWDDILFSLPGYGKEEDGDQFFLPVGKDYSEWWGIRFNEEDNILEGDIVLDEPGAGGDSLDLIICHKGEGTGVIRGDIIIKTDDNIIAIGDCLNTTSATVIVEGKVEIIGNRNRIIPMVGSNTEARLIIKGGIVIRGNDNVIKMEREEYGYKRGKVYVDGEGKLPIGVEITDGAKNNEIIVTVLNCDVGVKIHGEGTKWNRVTGCIGYEVDDKGNLIKKGPNGVGIEISDGAQYNELIGWLPEDQAVKYQAVKSYGVRYSKGDGIVIKGEGTDFNRIVENPDISISSGYNEGNGVHIKDGARFNRIEGNILYNKENGILIEGEGTDSNTVYVGHDNGLAGVAAVDGPKGTVIKLKASREGYANGTAIVLLRNIHSDDSPSAIVQGEFSPPEGKVPSSPCIILEDVSNARISARITGFPTGVLIKGENSRGNDILIEELAGSTTGVHITYKASSNIVRINSGAKDNKLIALIDGEASENTFRLISQGGNENGVIIRNGAKDNLLDRCTFKGETVIIEGDGTSGNRVENSSGMSLLIRDGATNTTIGSLVSGRGNTFSNLPLPFISVQGATTKGVRIIGNRFEGASSEGTRGAIEIENAQDVQIGSDQGAGGNTIIKNPCGILLKKAGKVKILNNLISENRSGIRAEGSSYEVTFQGNKIERNGEFGILIDGNDASKIAIEKNTLSQNGAGIKISGVSDLLISENEIKDSGSDGIRIGYSERGNIERNLITRNKGIGVHISNGSRYISIRSNAIYDNTGKGIAIERGCNGDIPKPFFTSFLASSRRISGGVPSSVPIGSTVEIFGDADDEGQIRLGVASVRAGRNFSTRLSRPLSSGMHLTATVTDPKGNTSEFSTKFKPQTHRPPFIVFTTTRFGNREIHRLFMGELTGTRLTDNPAVDQNPVLSPDHGKIAFVSERSGNPDIWLMGSDGSNLQNLTDNPADDLDPAWSPDGERIAFVSTRDGNPEIFVLDLKSGKLKQLTRTERDVINRHPTWSPDGKRIAFARGSTNGDNFEIFVMNSDGTGSVNITNNTAFDGQPAWSPDGGSIAFVSDRDGNREIYLVNPDGSGIRRLTEEKGEDIDPAWSEDGEILFSSNRDGEFEIYLIDSDGGNLRRVTLSLGINVQPNAGGQ